MGASMLYASLAEVSMTDSSLMTVIVIMVMIIMMMPIVCLSDFLFSWLFARLLIWSEEYVLICSFGHELTLLSAYAIIGSPDSAYLPIWFCACIWSSPISDYYISNYLLICYLFVRLSDWELIWSSAYIWLFDYMIMTRSAYLIIWFFAYLIIRLSNYLLTRSSDYLIVWLSDPMIISLFYY